MFDGSNLLAALRPEDHDLLRPAMKICNLTPGHVLYEPGDVVTHCYFPRHQALASYLVVLDCGRAVETILIGREGALGGLVSHGKVPAFARCCVMHEGTFFRIALSDLEEAKARSPNIGFLFARYADCQLAQIFQSVACNASHTIEQRAAKWLCAAVERIGSIEIAMTQEQLASIMGIGRSYASRVIQRLKAAGTVRTRRGGVEVVDPGRLMNSACSCNDLVRQHFDTVLGGVYPD